MSDSFPLVYRHAPRCFQGLELPEIYVEQEIEKIGRLLTHGATTSLTGEIMGCSLEQLQLEVGIGSPVLESPFEVYGHLATDGWFKNLWEFVSDEGITLRQDDPAIPPLQREYDEYIMEKLVTIGSWGPKDLQSFNRCRIKMQCVTMADIVHGDGKTLNKNMKSFSPEAAGNSKYDWANEAPSPQDWARWREGLKLLTSQNETLPFSERLGMWISEPHKVWEWFYSPTTRLLYRRVNNHTHEYAPVATTRAGIFTRQAITD